MAPFLTLIGKWQNYLAFDRKTVAQIWEQRFFENNGNLSLVNPTIPSSNTNTIAFMVQNILRKYSTFELFFPFIIPCVFVWRESMSVLISSYLNSRGRCFSKITRITTAAVRDFKNSAQKIREWPVVPNMGKKEKGGNTARAPGGCKFNIHFTVAMLALWLLTVSLLYDF